MMGGVIYLLSGAKPPPSVSVVMGRVYNYTIIQSTSIDYDEGGGLPPTEEEDESTTTTTRPW